MEGETPGTCVHTGKASDWMVTDTRTGRCLSPGKKGEGNLDRKREPRKKYGLQGVFVERDSCREARQNQAQPSERASLYVRCRHAVPTQFRSLFVGERMSVSA